MFILYYQESDYDYHKFELIKASDQREKLDGLKEKFEQDAKSFEEKVRAQSKANSDRYKKFEEEVRAFLLSNMDAIRRIRINSPFWPQESDWDNCHPDYVHKTRLQIIDMIAHSYSHYFYKYRNKNMDDYRTRLLTNLLWTDKLTEPILEIDTEAYPIPPNPVVPNPYYATGTLFIDEVEEM